MANLLGTTIISSSSEISNSIAVANALSVAVSQATNDLLGHVMAAKAPKHSPAFTCEVTGINATMVTAFDSQGNPSTVQATLGKAGTLQTASTVPSTGENPSGPLSNVQTDINLLRSGVKANGAKIAENKTASGNLSASQIKTTNSTKNVQQRLDELQAGMGGIISTTVGGIVKTGKWFPLINTLLLQTH